MTKKHTPRVIIVPGTREVATRALHVLRRVAAAHPDFLKLGFADGLAVAAGFHARLRAAFPASAAACPGEAPRPEGIA